MFLTELYDFLDLLSHSFSLILPAFFLDDLFLVDLRKMQSSLEKTLCEISAPKIIKSSLSDLLWSIYFSQLPISMDVLSETSPPIVHKNQISLRRSNLSTADYVFGCMF